MNVKRSREEFSTDFHKSSQFRTTSELDEIQFKYNSLLSQQECIMREFNRRVELVENEKKVIIQAASKEISVIKETSVSEMDGMKKCMNNTLLHVENQNRVIHFLRARLASVEVGGIRADINPYVDAF